MTVKPIATARARRDRRAARTIAWWAAIVIAVSPILSAPAAFAETASPTPTPTSTGTEGAASLVAAPTGSGLVPTGSDAVFSVSQRNETSRTLPAGAIAVALSRSPLASQQAVVDWVRPSTAADGEDAGAPATPALEEVARVEVADLAAGGERSTSIPVSATEKGLTALAPGVYPVAISGPGGETRTVITVPRADAPARTGAVIVPITAGPRTTGVLSAAELTELTAEGGALSEALDAVTGTSAILAVNPAIPASIRVLGSSAPASATAWLTALLDLPNERFALQFGDADLVTQVHAGLSSPLQPTTLSPYADVANFTRASGSGAGATVPDLTDLTAVGTASTTEGDVFWPASGTAGGDAVAAIGSLATSDAGALVLAPSDTVAEGSVVGRANAGDTAMLLYDSATSTELARVAATGDDATDRGAALAVATAQVSLTGDATLVAAVDRPTGFTRAGLRAAIAAVTGSPGVSATSLSQLRAADPASVTIVDVAVDQERVDALQRLLSDEERLATFATALVEPVQLTARERTAILQLIGSAWLADRNAWTSAIDAHEQATADRFGAVGIANPGTINFLATSAPISVTVRNDLPWPVSVVLFAKTGDPRLIVQEATIVPAGAQQNTRVDVPVEARVGSGETRLTLQLRSTTGVPIGSPETIALTVRAEWESVGLTAVIVIVVLLLAGGVIRTVLKLRRRGNSSDDDTTGDEPEKNETQQDQEHTE